MSMKNLSHKIKKIFLITLIISTTANAQTWIQLGTDLIGEAGSDYFGFSVALSDDGNTLAVGATNNDGAASSAGHVRIFFYNGSTWVQKGADIDGEAANNLSGGSLSISSDGNTIAIGAKQNAGSLIAAGHVRIYTYNGSAWIQKGADIDGEANNDLSGQAVNISDDGNSVAIGAVYNDGNGNDAGHVRIYSFNGSAWVQKGADINGEAATDYFGFSISMNNDGNIIAIGGNGNDGTAYDAGHVRVYSYNGSAWVQNGADIDGEAYGDQSGSSVSLSSNGSTLAIGAPYNNGTGVQSGHTRVYSYNGSSWVKKGADINGEAGYDNTGWSICISNDGNTIAIGGPGNDGNGNTSGHVRIYSYNGSAWVQVGIDINGKAAADYSGRAACLNGYGNTVAIGAYYNNNNRGLVRVYRDNSSVDINEITIQNDLSIYPNPSTGVFQLSTTSQNILKLEVYNLLGEIVYTIPNFNKQASSEINLLGYPKGIYFVKIYDGSDIHSKKIIVQ